MYIMFALLWFNVGNMHVVLIPGTKEVIFQFYIFLLYHVINMTELWALPYNVLEVHFWFTSYSKNAHISSKMCWSIYSYSFRSM